MTNGPFEMRHEEGGYVEFLNEDIPTVVREIDGRVAILTAMEQAGKIVGYRVYDPGSSPSEVFGSASPAGVVKPLEWEEDRGFWKAQTNLIACYSVWDCGDHWECSLLDGQFPSAEAAKSAAFADYSARIMSAIEPAGVGVETAPPATHMRGVLTFAADALRPMADAVFNDNGDMTVNLFTPTSEECIQAYFAEKKIRAALKGDEQ